MPKIIKQRKEEYLVIHYDSLGKCYAEIIRAKTRSEVKHILQLGLAKCYPYEEVTSTWVEGKPSYF